MVALNKTYLKTLTPDRSAKDSGHRFYSPEISRWLSRDPIGEDGGWGLCGFARNDPQSYVDLLGLAVLLLPLPGGGSLPVEVPLPGESCVVFRGVTTSGGYEDLSDIPDLDAIPASMTDFGGFKPYPLVPEDCSGIWVVLRLRIRNTLPTSSPPGASPSFALYVISHW